MNELVNIKDKLQKLIENSEQQLINSLGMRSYKSSSGFTSGQIYSYAGAKDYVTTLTLKDGSDSARNSGSELTVLFEYTIQERNSLEKDNAAMGWPFF